MASGCGRPRDVSTRSRNGHDIPDLRHINDLTITRSLAQQHNSTTRRSLQEHLPSSRRISLSPSASPNCTAQAVRQCGQSLILARTLRPIWLPGLCAFTSAAPSIHCAGSADEGRRVSGWVTASERMRERSALCTPPARRERPHTAAAPPCPPPGAILVPLLVGPPFWCRRESDRSAACEGGDIIGWEWGIRNEMGAVFPADHWPKSGSAKTNKLQAGLSARRWGVAWRGGGGWVRCAGLA
jgi:hypothetical protein